MRSIVAVLFLGLLGCAQGGPFAGPLPTPTASQPLTDIARTTTLQVSSSQSTARYLAQETIFGSSMNLTPAIGVTNSIVGDIALREYRLSPDRPSRIMVDISTLASDTIDRDMAIQSDWLESSKFPVASFTISTLDAPLQSLVTGEEYPLVVGGIMTIRDVDRPLLFRGTVQQRGVVIFANVTADILMTDFGIRPPDTAMLKVENRAKVNAILVLEPIHAPF